MKNTRKTSGQSRPASRGDNKLVNPVDHGEDMLPQADTDNSEIEKDNSLTGCAEERVFEEETNDDSLLSEGQVYGFEGDYSDAVDIKVYKFDSLVGDDGPVSDELDLVLDDFFGRYENTGPNLDKFVDLQDGVNSVKSEFSAEPTNDISEPSLISEDKTTEDYEDGQIENAVFPEWYIDEPVIVPKTNGDVELCEVTEEIVPGQLPEKQMSEREEVHIAVNAESGASINPKMRKVVFGSGHGSVISGKQLVIVIVVLLLLGAGWYYYHNMGDGNYTLQHQESRNNLDDYSEKGVTGLNQPVGDLPESINSGIESVDEPQQKISEQLKNTSGDLERRVSSEEQNLSNHGNGDQPAQVNKQLKLPGKVLSIETDQPGGVEEMALEDAQHKTDMRQFENQVSQLPQEQNTVRNTASSSEKKTFVGTTAQGAIEVKAESEQEQKRQQNTVRESITSKFVSGTVEQRISAIPSKKIHEVKESVFFRHDKPILSENGAEEQTSWVVNLSSFRKLSSAQIEQEQLIGLGLETVISKTLISGTYWFRVQIEGFSSNRAAREYIKLNLDSKKFKDAWVLKKIQ